MTVRLSNRSRAAKGTKDTEKVVESVSWQDDGKDILPVNASSVDFPAPILEDGKAFDIQGLFDLEPNSLDGIPMSHIPLESPMHWLFY